MDHVPVDEGRPCVFRVVRVSGTIRKSEEEAIRQAKRLILAVKDQEANSMQSSMLSYSQNPDRIMTDVTEDSNDDDAEPSDGD